MQLERETDTIDPYFADEQESNYGYNCALDGIEALVLAIESSGLTLVNLHDLVATAAEGCAESVLGTHN